MSSYHSEAFARYRRIMAIALNELEAYGDLRTGLPLLRAAWRARPREFAGDPGAPPSDPAVLATWEEAAGVAVDVRILLYQGGPGWATTSLENEAEGLLAEVAAEFRFDYYPRLEVLNRERSENEAVQS